MPVTLLQSLQDGQSGITAGLTFGIQFPGAMTAGAYIVASHAHWTGVVGGTASAMPLSSLKGNVALDTTLLSEQAAGVSPHNGRSRLFTAGNATVTSGSFADTITFGLAVSVTWDFWGCVSEWSGLGTSPAIQDTAQAGPTTGTAVSAGDVDPGGVDGCLLYTTMTWNGATTTLGANDTGWNDLAENLEGDTSAPLVAWYKVQTTATVEDADMTLGASLSWVAGTVALGPPPAALTRMNRDKFPRPKLRTPGWGQRGGRVGGD